MPRKPLTPIPSQRLLRVYAFDPSRGARLHNQLTIRIPFEELKKGPVGRKVAVIDYDASNACYYEGITLDSPNVLVQNGLEPSETNPQFHQQMAYAVVMETIRRFETGVYRTRAHLRVSPLGLRRLQSFAPTVAESATRTASAPDADGWMRVTIPIESVEDAARELLRLGTEAEALEPTELREQLKAAVARIAALYSEREDTRAQPPPESAVPKRLPVRRRRPR